MPKNKSPKNSETDSSSTDELAPDFPSRIVGIGASAGGLEALELFFDNMPINSGMAFVVVQHLSPDHPSMMNDLLSKHTKMVVRGVAIFAKACFGHPSPSKRQKLNATTNAFGAPDVLRTCHFATIIVNSMLAS